MSPGAPSAGNRPVLTRAQARKFAVVRGVLQVSVVGSFLFLVAGIVLLTRHGSPAWIRAVVWGIFIELAGSAAVLGAFARCPACTARLGSEPGRLLPSNCSSCGVRLIEQSVESDS